MAGTDHAPYLLALRLAGRRVTIIGGGAVAARRLPALLDSGADVVVISPELSPPLARLAAAGRIRWIRRGYAPGDCAGSWLVGAFTSDPRRQLRRRRRGRRRGDLVRPGRRRGRLPGLDARPRGGAGDVAGRRAER